MPVINWLKFTLMKLVMIQKPRSVAKHFSLLTLCLLLATAGFCQFNVTEIITDYGGYWKSSASAINSVKPDNSHNLVSFSFKGNRYSTGVNDALLTSKGQTFVAGDYRALPVKSMSGVATSNTKIGLGYMYDGVANGASSPAPANNIPYYLTDGIKGLNLGTCVANLPAGSLMFPISKIIKSSIGDSIPDVLVTQIADPSGSLDRYEFLDLLGNRVGNYVDIQLDNIASVANWTADFYEASKNPMTLSGGYTRTDRPIRLWASDLSAFGIDSSNSSRIAYFRITLNGNSDVAFVAYNNNSINIFDALLPITLSSFTAQENNNQVQLNWSTTGETGSDAFVIERSTDGDSFTAIDKVAAAGNTTTAVQYSYTDKQPAVGKNYYRLKMTDLDGQYTYSKTVVINKGAAITGSISLYPNPATNYIVINHPYAGSNEQVTIVNLQGTMLLQKKITAASFQTRLELPAMAAGIYELVWTNGKEMSANQLVLK